VNSKAVMYILGLAPFRMSDVGRKEVDILRLGLEGILLEAVACADFPNTLTIKLGQFASTQKIGAKNANSSNIFSVR